MRWAPLAAAGLAVFAAPASAQEATPVVGAGSFTTAPILEPGTYRDTILPEEYVYYAVRVGAGQRLRVTGRIGLTTGEMGRLGLTSVDVNLHAPDRTQILDAESDSSTTGSDGDPIDAATPPATTTAEASQSSPGAWTGPGVYFIAPYALFVGAGELTKAEVPIEFTVAVEGDAQAEPSPAPTASPTATATPTAAAPAVEEDRSPMVAAGAGIGGVLAGVAAGIALRQRRR